MEFRQYVIGVCSSRAVKITMDNELFNELLKSITQMDEIRRGERVPSRETHISSERVARTLRGIEEDSPHVHAEPID